MSLNLVLYSNNEPFNTTKRLIIESVHKFTRKNLIIHDYNLDIIKSRDWFQLIKDLPSINKIGRRDGYYNSWKAYITKEVYDLMNEGDILYYVDCSRYFVCGFTENIDKLCNIVNSKLFIAGSVGINVRNNSFNCCDNIVIWNKIIPDRDNTLYLNNMHILNSWFILKKHKSNDDFLNEWVYYTSYIDNDIKTPMVTYHHTGDQSIFNILVYKYNMYVFFCNNIHHDTNKNKNVVLNIINNSDNIESYFIKKYNI
jgi:hypothetical protein